MIININCFFLVDTDLSEDENYDPGQESTEEYTEESRTRKPKLRSDAPDNIAEVQKILNYVCWTIPSFPVLTIEFTKIQINIKGKLQEALFNASDFRISQLKLPCKIEYTSFCQIDISGSPMLVLWKWKPWILPGLSDNESEESMSTISTISSNNENEINSEREEHTLPFKVLGVAHCTQRQKHLKEAYIKLRNYNNCVDSIKAKIEPDPQNAFDENAIAVSINYGDGWKLIGFIAKELTKYIHPQIRMNNIKEVSIESICYRVTYAMIGYYAKLNITRIGAWEGAIISASRNVE
jgi:hypothetical protein